MSLRQTKPHQNGFSPGSKRPTSVHLISAVIAI